MEKIGTVSQGEIQPKAVKPVKEVERTEVVDEVKKTATEFKRYTEGEEIANQFNDKPMTQDTMKQAVSDANSKMKHSATACEFGYNEKLSRVTIKVVDKETRELVREVPAEETLEMIEKIWEIAGLLVDEKL